MWAKSVVVCERRSLSVSVTEWSRRGPSCVLLHGFGDAACVWNHLAIRIAQQFHVVAMDLRGHGNSDWDPETRYDSETFTADLTKTVAAFGFERMILVGHSLGADVAVRFAAANTSRVAALVIVDFGPECDKAGIDEVLQSFAAMPRAFTSVEEYAQWLIEHRPLADPSLLRQFARYNLRRSASQGWEPKADAALATHSQIGRLDASDGRYCWPDLWPALARISCPSLVVRGMASGVLPYDVARRMVDRALPDGQLATIAAAGHAVMMDNPAEFSASVGGFLANIPA
jgi:pimeloyl-ACP methyl ester carboxylesterase